MKECDKLRERNHVFVGALSRAHGIMFNSATWNWPLHLLNARLRSIPTEPALRVGVRVRVWLPARRAPLTLAALTCLR